MRLALRGSMTLANYFAMGWFNGYLDKYYIDSWKVWFSIVIVFNGLGNFGLGGNAVS